MSFTTGEHALLQPDGSKFDFNLQFEQLFFSIVPSALFIAASAWRTLSQVQKPIIVDALTFQRIKSVAIAIYGCLGLALVVVAAVGTLHVTSMFIAAAVLRLVAALLMMPLSVIDHSRSPRPSTLLTSYLSLSLLLDVAQTRTLFLSSSTRPERVYSGLFCAAVAIKAVLLLLEARQKTRWVRWASNEKEHSPEETSGIFSLGGFFWLNKLFLAGYRTVLTIETLLPLDSYIDAEALHAKFSQRISYVKLKSDKYAVSKALARTLKVPLLLPIAPRLAQLGFTLCQPLFIERLLRHLSEPEPDVNVGYGLIGASFLIYLGITISWAFTWYFHHRLRIVIRSILVPEIFIKATNARIGIADDSAALTLMSTDMERITAGFRTLHETWACIIQAALTAWMLYSRLGIVFVVPIGMVVCCTIGLGILMHFIADAQRAWMTRVQKRVGLTATIIASMKNLKISGLTTAIGSFVQKLRLEELASASRFRVILIIAALFGYTPMLITPPLTFAFTQRRLDASTIFTSLTFITLLTGPLSDVFQSIPQVVSAFACLGRIQAFLESETREDFRQILPDRRPNDEKTPENAEAPELAIKDGSFGWEADKFVLRNVNTRISKSSLTIVVGPVGSGKSTLCKALLGEIPFSGGSVVSNSGFTHVGYCDQSAFLSNGSVKDNIIGFSPFNSERYSEVINATALNIDLGMLPQGDGTNVGSDGITLSGGQKQRVALARALYLGSNLLVLDDIFSGLDADTEEQVFQKVFALGGLLQKRQTTVVLCTHSVKHLPAADYIIVLGNGTITEQGSFKELMNSQGYVQRLGLKDKSDDHVSSETTLSTHGSAQDDLQTTTAKTQTTVPGTDPSRKVGDMRVYKHYAKSMGVFLAGLSLFFAALWGLFTNFPTIWLTYWTNDVYSEHPVHSYAYYAGLYAMFQVCALLSLMALGICLWVVALVRAGSKLHQDILTTLVHAPLRFFTMTDTGIVTNLFSQDLNLVDTELPQALLSTLYCVFQALGQAAVMLTSSAYLGIAYPFLVIILTVMGRFYLRTSRQLRLLDLEAKTPLYTHFLDTVKGITTLRAFGFIPNDIRKNAQLVNTSQRPAYLLLMIQEWLNIILGFVVMMMAVVLVTLSIQLQSKAAFAGASLYSLISLGENLSGIVVFWTRLETCLGAIARLKTFNDTVKPEDRDEEDIIPAESWPQNGVVELRGVSAAYDSQEQSDSSLQLALRDIRLSITAGEKVAICGRTGSGKSSLIALLLKLLDPISSTAENVVIDGTPLHRINRSALRQRIIAVPQEAVFLPDGTDFQTNLDPLSISTPEECEAVLAAVGLSKFVAERGGLSAGMSATTLSAGQRQLMSVGRALLRRRIQSRHHGPEKNGGILLLDEVSSSVDLDTERVMQDIIKTEFEDYTVIAVSHRLHMIMEFDRVVVMDMGKIVEVGNPTVLARQAVSRFGDLVRAGNEK